MLHDFYAECKESSCPSGLYFLSIILKKIIWENRKKTFTTHPPEWLNLKRQKNAKWGYGTNGMLKYCWWEFWQYNHFGNRFGSIRSSWAFAHPLTQQLPSQVCPTEMQTCVHHKTPQECSQQHYVWKPRTRTIHMFINTRMDEQIAAILLSHESEWPTNTGKYTECYTKEARSKRTSYRTPFK